jgi:hypothetical protein
MTQALNARKSVTLSDAQKQLVELARAEGTPQHEAVVRLLGDAPVQSEAAALQALLGYALDRLGEEVALHDYELLAASRTAEDEAHEATMRTRARR